MSLLFSNKTTEEKMSTTSSKQMKPANVGNYAVVLQLICNLLFKIFENEQVWPDALLRAFVDDSLNERNWIDSDMCGELVHSVVAVFNTKIIPFSFESKVEK
jgi:hypothetical protein